MYRACVKRFLSRTGYQEVHLKAALIDMDGTLYDSMPHHAEAWRQMMSETGIDAPSDDFFRYEGRTGASTIDILFKRFLGRGATDEEKTSLYRRKTELFAAMPAVEVMPGARRMIDFLITTGITRVLVTGSGQNTLLQRLDTDFPQGFPESLRITSRNVTHGKPSPEPYLKAMTAANVKPWECIVVENAPLGVESGHASGAFTVGITTGPLPARELEDAGADIVFSSMNEFADALPLLHQAFLTTTNHS